MGEMFEWVVGSAAMTTSTGGIELGRLKAEETALFVCDVQERFRSVISGYTAVVDVARRMVRVYKCTQLKTCGVTHTRFYMQPWCHMNE